MTHPSSFLQTIKNIDLQETGIEGYQLSYLQHLVKHIGHYSRIYKSCILRAEEDLKQNRKELVFLDYGSGTGMLGVYAKHYGYGKVICCDVDASSIRAAHQLNKIAGNSIDHIIHGDINDVKQFCRLLNIKPDLVIGTDVIEHIYDLNQFVHTLAEINPLQVNVFTTASNPENKFKVRELQKLQQRDELEGGYSVHITKYEDSNHFEEPYLLTREKIIQQMNLNLPPAEVKKLAISTRGKNKADIESAVRNYMLKGTLPSIDENGFNTCEPYTGSWSERIIPLNIYEQIFEEAGFKISISNGFYNDVDSKMSKRIFSKLLNMLVLNTGSIGRKIAPFIFLKGVSGK